MLIEPQTDLILLKTPLESDNAHQLNFADAAAQSTYFLSLPKIVKEGFTYQRKDNIVRFPAGYDELIGYNYAMYRNAAYSDKWFYAYIDSMEYASDEMTKLQLKTDVFQTWQFDIQWRRSFVEREHVNDDTIGLHTIPEGLELGELVQNTSTKFEPNKTVWTSGHTEQLMTKYMIVFQVTELPEGSYGISRPHQYNGTYSGLFYVGVKTPTDATYLIRKYDQQSKSDSIIAIFMAPTAFFDGAEFSNILVDSHNVMVFFPIDTDYASSMSDGDYSISRPTTLDGYIPKNGKMLTYPYTYLTIDNNAGVCITERFENFKNGASPSFYMGGALGQGCSLKLAPIGYKGQLAGAENYQEGVMAMKLPICAWASDYYTNWLTQNALNIPLTIATTIGATGLAVATGGTGLAVAGGAVLSAGTQIGNLLSERYQASLVPDQAHGNANASDINLAWQQFFTVKCMSVKAEFAEVIDNFFSQFGYKVNLLKLPNITGRRNWNYVKTVECNIFGDIPEEDVHELKMLFNRGITIWHNPSTFLDYSQNNDIIS